jgi:hypothetical protein
VFHYELDRGWLVADALRMASAAIVALVSWRPRSYGWIRGESMSGAWLREHEQESVKHAS